MESKKRRKKGSFVGRAAIILLAIGLEAAIIAFIFTLAGDAMAYIEVALRIVGAVVVLAIIRHSKSISSNLIWILLIDLFPVPGTITYILLNARTIAGKTYGELKIETDLARKYYVQNDLVYDEMCTYESEHKGQLHYISKTEGFPFYRDEGCDYYSLGELGFPHMLEALKNAKRFIFLEFFIIGEGVMWESILDILEQKVKEGVDVRVIYDDLGTIFKLPSSYAEELEQKGIKCICFNRIHPVLNTIMNRRDHRKIMVIDGDIAFSGGINLADEYINVEERFGQWKDNIIRIKGEAVWSMTVMFLTHWNALRKEDSDYNAFRGKAPLPAAVNGYISPYCDSPLDEERVSQDICQGIINQAKKYCYIFTPYLIVDNELENTLIYAAKRGIDVRIITPGIPDKKIVWYITRSYYRPLLEGGVKIYEYTPGFMHSKVVVSDDHIATVGTVNLDYRSMYFQFENGLYLCGCKAIGDVKKDFLESVKKSREISIEDCNWGLLKDFLLSCLRIFAPLL